MKAACRSLLESAHEGIGWPKCESLFINLFTHLEIMKPARVERKKNPSNLTSLALAGSTEDTARTAGKGPFQNMCRLASICLQMSSLSPNC